ncbi:hypothetical protein H4219_001010 [Mycoemilia scoparia]|uniref:Major facilitator superfamily (MFS) profile domain-containing protein n=1 Tax=Mycoemilia scoparia TaxID=417184 RepID=A0A9W8DWC3_9FUNG|nr:hypothetical protein H4219_001010 [Mycoemilia scoparia]
MSSMGKPDVIEQERLDDYDGHGRRNIFRRILHYYSQVETQKNAPQSIEEIRMFFGLFKCNPWVIIVAGIIAQFLYGSVYSWSIFNEPINRRIYGNPDANMAQITYYIALGVLGTTGALMGPWIESHHPRISTLIGCLLFFAGHMIAGLAMYFNLIGLLYFGYGIVCGMGLGLGYVATVDVVTKWFPKTRGLASGIAVAGFGAGSMAFTTIDKKLIERFDVPGTFLFLGMIMLVIQTICSQFMVFPPVGWNSNGVVVVGSSDTLTARGRENIGRILGQKPGEEKEHTNTYHQLFENDRPVVQISLASAISSRDFWFLYMGFLANILFGLVIISNLANMVSNLFGVHSHVGKATPLDPSTVVTIESAFNTAGRVFTGFFSDRLGRKTTFLCLLGIQIIVICILPHAMINGVFWEFCILLWIATWCYGGGFGMIPAFLADMFGVDNTSSCHGIFLTAWSVSSIGGGLLFTAIIKKLTNDGRSPHDAYIYNVNLYWMLSIVILGFLFTLFVRATARDRLFPAAPGQLLRIRIFGRIFRVSLVPNPYDTQRPSTPETDQSSSTLKSKVDPKRWKFEFLSPQQEQSMWEEYLLLRAIQSRLRKSMV